MLVVAHQLGATITFRAQVTTVLEAVDLVAARLPHSTARDTVAKLADAALLDVSAEMPLSERLLPLREAYDAGELLPDWFANYIFEDVALSLRPEQGIVCDGYPRTLAQAERFASVMDWLERPYRVIDLAVENEEVTARMLKRAEEEHRPDSATPERIKARLTVYDSYTAPLLGYFKERNLLTELDGSKTPDEVAAEIRAALDS